MKIQHILLIVVALSIVLPCSAKQGPPVGILAASIDDTVVLLETSSGDTVSLKTGPIGWLFPAPGGIVFAPDVINGITSVINLRSQAIVGHLEGLTMPHFGLMSDRYIALPGNVLVLSYPERSIMAKIEAEIRHPWQVVFAPEDAALLILERLPDGSTGIHLTTVNLLTNQTVFRRPLGGDIRHMAVSPTLGLLAFADAQAGAVHLVQPATLNPMAERTTPGSPIDVTFAHAGKILATATAIGDGKGILDLALFKSNKKGLHITKEFAIPLDATPVRIALSPDGEHVAIALEGGGVVVILVDKQEVVATYQLPGTPRDLRWCDPSIEGPIVPEWSDGKMEEEGYDPYVPRVTDGSSNGLTAP